MTIRTPKPKAPPLFRGEIDRNPPGIGFWALVREDRLTQDDGWLSQGFWALFWHRFGNWRMSVRTKLLRAPLTILYNTMYKASEIVGGIKLSYTIPVGRRVKIEHFGGMIFGARQIGSDVVLRQNTTLGIASREDLNAKPTLEDGAEVGAGAVIVGDVVIGARAIVGANAVVTKSVPPGAIVGGIPARILRYRDGMAPPDASPAEVPASAAPAAVVSSATSQGA